MMLAVTIDNASSYSDIDSSLGDDLENRVSSSSTRNLPDWTSASSLNARAQDAGVDASSSATRRLPNWSLASSLNAKAQEVDTSSSATTRKLPNWSSNISYRGKYIKGVSHKKLTHGSPKHHLSSGTSSAGSEKQTHPVVQTDGRALPSSFHPSASQSKPYNLRNTDHRTSTSHNDVTKLPCWDKRDSRILPSWMCPLASSFGCNASSSDPHSDSDAKNARPDEKIASDESSVFQAVLQDLNQPKEELDVPDGLLLVPLLRHQKIALAWMYQKEARPFCTGGILADDQGLGKTVSIIALILLHKHKHKESEKNFISEDQPAQKIESLNLDDDNDDGLSDLDALELKEGSESIKSSSKACSSRKERADAGTLVVCPATVLRQWYRELNDKVAGEANLQVLMYHGSSRTKDPSELAKYDVVLTTYAIVANEVPKELTIDKNDDDDDDDDDDDYDYGLPAEISMEKRKIPFRSRKKGKKVKKDRKSVHSSSSDVFGALARVNWLRVVLDEAQMIKNHRTRVARACWGLRGRKRWCLSGTPIQNTLDELFSYFRFLKYDPYSSYTAFCEGIKGPISRDSQYGYQKVQAVLRTVMLRRTKGTMIDGKPVISLPPKFVQMKNVDFTLEEREFYAKLEAKSRSQFKAYSLAGTVRQNYANILLMLLRLRQACDHPSLAWGSGSDSVRRTSSIMPLKELSKDSLMNLLNCFEGSCICQFCADPPEDAVVAMCGHVYCDQCLLDHLNGDDLTCPASRCKEQLSNDIVFSELTLRARLPDDSKSSGLSRDDQCDGNLFMLSSNYCSSKIRAALEILQSLCEPSTLCVDLDGTIVHDDDSAVSADPIRTQPLHSASSDIPKKAIVFSQWTRMLDLMGISLQKSNFQYRRLDGTMTLPARDKAVREFCTDPQVTVMLMSLKAGNLGLNMVAACHVILLDLWWNPTTEDQAVDRAHRIGQVHPVTVSRITIKDTVEDRILALQDQKKKMVASAFGDESGDASASRLDLHDLKFLFTGVR